MDLYTLLGVPHGASSDAIERAYRRLARRYHPGVNPGDRAAEERYRQIQSAYDVLGNEARRREYDGGGAGAPIVEVQATISFDGFDFSAPVEERSAATFSELFADVFQDAARQATGSTPDADIELRLSVSFQAAVRGEVIPLSVMRQDRCHACQGHGRVPRPPVLCQACGGQGTRRWARGHMVFTKACEICDGQGQLVSQLCRGCAGAGVAPRSELVTVQIPAGVEHGTRVAVPGRGHARPREGSAGDLYLTIEVGAHPYFQRQGRDLLLTLPVCVHEAALGARVEVPTLDAPVQTWIPPGTASGSRLRLRGLGVSDPSGAPDEAGDLIVEIQIVLPAVTDERSRELLREFGQLNNVDVRRHLFQV